MKNVALKKSIALALGAAFVFTACTKAGGTAEGGRANAWTQPHVLVDVVRRGRRRARSIRIWASS